MLYEGGICGQDNSVENMSGFNGDLSLQQRTSAGEGCRKKSVATAAAEKFGIFLSPWGKAEWDSRLRVTPRDGVLPRINLSLKIPPFLQHLPSFATCLLFRHQADNFFRWAFPLTHIIEQKLNYPGEWWFVRKIWAWIYTEIYAWKLPKFCCWKFSIVISMLDFVRSFQLLSDPYCWFLFEIRKYIIYL